jgi:RHS repeat-associated protein
MTKIITMSNHFLLIVCDKENNTYYLSYNHIETLKTITCQNNQIIKTLDYDSFGNILSDTNPTLHVPLGFAGGLYDKDTKLTKFGYRDYDSYTGRWTSKDPIDFNGGDTNLYNYVMGDPVNLVDPEGLEVEVDFWMPIGFGKSSFGHVSSSINGITFSFGPNGMSVLPTSEYHNKNSFRDGFGIPLSLTIEQEKSFQKCLGSNQGNYDKFTNNCGDPIERCLNNIGVSVGNSLFPASTANSLINSGYQKGYNDYPTTNPSSGLRAPWAK